MRRMGFWGEYQKKIMEAGHFTSIPNRPLNYNVILDYDLIVGLRKYKIIISNRNELNPVSNSVIIGFPEGLGEHGEFLFDVRLICPIHFINRNECKSLRGVKPFTTFGKDSLIGPSL